MNKVDGVVVVSTLPMESAPKKCGYSRSVRQSALFELARGLRSRLVTSLVG